jgi:hypothetical protein
MKTKDEILEGLAHCIGTQGYHYNALFGKNFVYTDGVKYLLEAANCYWLLDAIFSYKKTEDFQVWSLKVENGSAVLTMKEDSGQPNIVKQEIPYTDFPLDEIEFFAINDHNCGGEWGPVHVVLMLKSEY